MVKFLRGGRPRPFRTRVPRAGGVSRVRSWLASLDLVVLMAAALVLVGLWVFVALAILVEHGTTQALDEQIMLSLRHGDDRAVVEDARRQVSELAARGDTAALNRWIAQSLRVSGPSPWAEEMFRDLTALGGVVVLTLTTLAVVGYLLLCRMNGAALLVVLAALGGWCLSTLLKHAFDRPRPGLVTHLSHAYTSSFPSGHSMLSAVIYLTLGALLSRFVRRLRRRLYILGVAILLTTLVGVSRVYLGVHYPTDVLAGWSVGLVWAMVCWLAARFLQSRGAVEPPAG
jgi:undecaprenyl-diphosphatase